MMLRLRVRAPFAACRTFSAGAYRPVSAFITPSAAYGLLLNIGAIETRRDDGVSPMTVTATRLPEAAIAIGAVRIPEVQTLYQQLHNYPVGATGKGRAEETKGNKYNIQPVRRELLAGIDAYICLAGNDLLEERVRQGLRDGAQFNPDGMRRYGVPFLGDNNFLLSHLEEERVPQPAYWYRRLERDEAAGATNVSRFTVWVDRREMAKTATGLYQRDEEAAVEVPDDAWTLIRPPAEG